MSDSSSSSASSDEKQSKRKKDKSKKDKKSKKHKKVKKDDKKKKKVEKEKKRAEAAEDWWCERLESVRLIRQLLQIEPAVAEELEGLFTALDEGEVVHLDGLANKQVKKKLRHLLQAMKLTATDGTGFKSADRKVSFSALFASLHKKALASGGASDAAGEQAALSTSAQEGAHSAATAAEEISGTLSSRDVEEEEAADAEAATLQSSAQKARPKRVGPQLPMPGVGPVDADEGSSEDDQDQGPKMEGAERAGVDLDSLPTTSRRDKWMTEAHESMSGLFDDSVDCRTATGGRFEIKRSQAEEESFEKAMRERGPSLMSQTKEGKFADTGARDEVERLRKKQRGEQDLWGASAKEQERARPAAAAAVASGVRKAFDPETDLIVRKPISGEAFTKFVETSGSELAGRFSRGAVATSFL